MAAEVVAVTAGNATTVTVEVLDELQDPELPVTVYTVVDEGVTLMLAEVAPVFHE